MKIVRKSQAGSLESSDILILVEPVKKGEGRNIKIESGVQKQYGDRIEQLVNDVLDDNEVDDIHLIISDKGAIETVILARMETVLLRASNQQKGTLY